MKNNYSQAIDGRVLYYAFVSGGKRILQNQSEINRINVFPVSDKDTGTNLASTIRSVIDNIKPNKSYKTTFENIAESALIGARGNSGVIFAQFLYGISQETKNINKITLSDFVESIKKSIPYIYKAISNPVEGTMLTVIKEWSEFLETKKNLISDFKNIFIESLNILQKSLNETTSKMKILSQHNFVDAGAKGFVLFIEGIIDFIKSGDFRKISSEISENITIVHDDEIHDETITYRYCTEAILKNLKISGDELKKTLNFKGDSVVIAGSENICRLHIHTDKPAELFYELKDFGTITFQKVDDMVRQREIASNRKWKIALVTDSTCDLSQELIDFYQINVVPININFGDNHYLDKVTVQPEQFYDLLDTNENFPKTSQINEKAFTNIYSHLASHYDEIIAVHLTGKFSGTYERSVKAGKRIEKEFNKPVHVLDSQNLSGALGLMVLKIAKAIEEGKTSKEILYNFEKWRNNSKIFVSVKDIKYMIKGGRVSKTKGIIVKLLGINPIVSIDENGNSQLFGKAFSHKSNMNKVIAHIKKITEGKSVWNYIILHAHNFEDAEKQKNKMIELTGKEPVSIVNISPVIGMHAGIGAIAISLLIEN